jgi:molecular chaperone GrpE
MREPLEGLDPTAEAEVDLGEVAPAASPDVPSLRRALNDLEAAKARVERDAERAAQQMREQLVGELLPLLDNLDRTIRAAEQARNADAVLQGTRLVRNQFAAVLARFGVERIDALRKPFDPSQHDAIATVAVTHPSAHNVVVDQVEPGYRYGARLLRPAKVVVGRLQQRYH